MLLYLIGCIISYEIVRYASIVRFCIILVNYDNLNISFVKHETINLKVCPYCGTGTQNKTKQLLIKEGFNLINQYKPNNMSTLEHAEWIKSYEKWHKDLLRIDAKEIDQIEEKIHNLLKPRL